MTNDKKGQDQDPKKSADDLKKQILGAVKGGYTGEQTSKWILNMNDEALVKQIAAASESTNILDITVAKIIDLIFDDFQRYVYEYQRTAAGARFILNCQRPTANENPTTVYGQAPILCQGHLSTANWVMIVQGKVGKVSAYTVPVEFLVGFKATQNNFTPFVELKAVSVKGKTDWRIDDNSISKEMLPIISKRIFGVLIKVERGDAQPDERFFFDPSQAEEEEELPPPPGYEEKGGMELLKDVPRPSSPPYVQQPQYQQPPLSQSQQMQAPQFQQPQQYQPQQINSQQMPAYSPQQAPQQPPNYQQAQPQQNPAFQQQYSSQQNPAYQPQPHLPQQPQADSQQMPPYSPPQFQQQAQPMQQPQQPQRPQQPQPQTPPPHPQQQYQQQPAMQAPYQPQPPTLQPNPAPPITGMTEMFERNKIVVGQSLDELIARLDQELDSLARVGMKAIQNQDMAAAQFTINRATRLKDVRQRVNDLTNEWKSSVP